MSSRFPKIDTVSDILSRVNIGGKKLEKNEIDKLLKLKHGDEAMLMLKNRPFLYDIIGLIEIMGFDNAYDYLKKEQKSDSNTDILKKAPPYKEARLQYYLTLTEKIREKANEKDSLKECPRCKTRKVRTEVQQTRRADEPLAEINTCRNCGYTWKD